MACNTKNPAADAAVADASNAHEVKKLHDLIVTLDAISQGGLSEIEAIARLALHRLESPAHHCGLADVATALIAIRARASDTQNCINAEAERVGCAWVDNAAMRRQDALYACSQNGAAGGVA